MPQNDYPLYGGIAGKMGYTPEQIEAVKKEAKANYAQFLEWSKDGEEVPMTVCAASLRTSTARLWWSAWRRRSYFR